MFAKIFSSGVIVAAYAFPSLADIYSEDFEALPAPYVPTGWVAQQLPSPASASASVTISLTSELSGANQSLLMSVDSSGVSDDTAWSAIASIDLNLSLPTTDLSKLSLTADISASEAGHSLVIHFWSYADDTFSSPTGKLDYWLDPTTTAVSSFGGLLSDFANNSTFGFDATAQHFYLGFRISSAFGYDSGNELRIDNVRLAQVPEPRILAVVAPAMLLFTARRCGKP